MTAAEHQVPADWQAAAARERLRCVARAARPALDDLYRRSNRLAALRARRLDQRQAALHRCDGCGDWLAAGKYCTTCPAIAADRAARAHLSFDPRSLA